MKSVKSGRGPSMMGGIMGIFVALFGVAWTVAAAGMGGGIMVTFGIFFTAAAVGMSIYNFRNATAKNRYSIYDITEDGEETDPLNVRFGADSANAAGTAPQAGIAFCPYCGRKAEENYEFCAGCGKKLPD